jgi:hypothetical protein
MSTSHKRRQALARWIKLLRERFPTFSKPEVTGLALWSIGIVLARSSSLHAVALALSVWLGLNPLTLQKRLQEWYLEAAAKKGHGSGGAGRHRCDWNPRALPPFLLRWIVEDWPNNQLVFALDPTNFGDRFTVLAISVLYRGCAVPVMWTVVEGGKPEAWEPHWERMLRDLAHVVPPGWQVLVLSDRGLYSPRLFRCLVDLNWHPFMRIRAQGFYRPDGSHNWLKLEDLQLANGEAKAWQGEVFKNDPGRLHCTLACCKGEGYAEAWLIVTDLLPEVARASWYGLRGWIEQGFKRVKGEGWNLPRTRISSCERLERLWLAVAVATLWVLEVGGEADAAEQARPKRKAAPKKVGEDTPDLPELSPGKEEPIQAKKQAPKAPKRIWSVFARGWQLLRNALAVGVLLLGSWHPEPWPDHPSLGLPPISAASASSAAAAGQRLPRPPPTCSIPGFHLVDSS